MAQNRSYSATFRIIHWLIAITFVLLLLTIFLRLTWLNKENVAIIIENFLSEKNISLTTEEVLVLAKQIRKPMWTWHIYLGYFLTCLYILRLALGSIGKMHFVNPFNKNFSLQEKFQYFVYVIFYLLFGVSLVTGLFIVHGPSGYKSIMESIHELSIYYLFGFIIIHISGVLLAEFTKYPGIISKIITGRDY